MNVCNNKLTKFLSIICALAVTTIVSGQELLPTPIPTPAINGPLSLPPNDFGPEAAPQDQDLEELARGPVHEAFAEQITYDPIPGPIVLEAPPAPVSELPPEFKPEGENIVFIGGYWFWDDSRDSYIWISGGYRQLPPDQTWVEGYWHEVDGGWQRVSGFFAVNTPQTSSYYRAPPESLELGPVGQAPSQDYAWSPGYWESQGDDYVWRVGNWYECRPNWVWVPRYWRWTPRGCILVGGYWDFPWEQRGQVFAPIFFNRPIYNQVGWSYRPRIILRAAALQLHLFVRPNHGHYYFGDYYGNNYFQSGFIPWHAYHTRYTRIGCDPIFTYNSWNYRRQGLDFVNVSLQWNRYFNQHPNYRPPRTFGAQQNFITNINNININNTTINNTTIINQAVLTDRLDRAVEQNRGINGKWSRLDANQMQRELKTSEQWRESKRQRAEFESASVFLRQNQDKTLDPERQRRWNELAKAQQTASSNARKQAVDQLQRKEGGGNPNARQKITIDRTADRELQRKLNQELVQSGAVERLNLPSGKRRGDEPKTGPNTRNNNNPNTPDNRDPRGNSGNRIDNGNRGNGGDRIDNGNRGNGGNRIDNGNRGNQNDNDRRRGTLSPNESRNTVPGLLPVPNSGKVDLGNPRSNSNDRGNLDRNNRDPNRNAAGEIVVPKNSGQGRPLPLPSGQPSTNRDTPNNNINNNNRGNYNNGRGVTGTPRPIEGNRGVQPNNPAGRSVVGKRELIPNQPQSNIPPGGQRSIMPAQPNQPRNLPSAIDGNNRDPRTNNRTIDRGRISGGNGGNPMGANQGTIPRGRSDGNVVPNQGSRVENRRNSNPPAIPQSFGNNQRNSGSGRSFTPPPRNNDSTSNRSSGGGDRIRSNPPGNNRGASNPPRNQSPPKSGGGGGRNRDK